MYEVMRGEKVLYLQPFVLEEHLELKGGSREGEVIVSPAERYIFTE